MQARRGTNWIRPFQGRPLWGARFPGALPPATLSIPSGDQESTVLKTFWGAKSN
jgi:hypothetical protein